jgi:2-polyprenyl-3-methyl-5-hydroxy-6-metoxy-1,4-benzoquinol methylase
VVGCDVCGVIFSNPIYPENVLIEQYRDAEYIMEEQTSNYLVAYREEFMRTLEAAGKIDSLLEVGCADGYFLRVAKDMGIPNICGIEPGKDAVEKADDDLRHLIYNGVFHEGLYEENSFDMVCMFQVLDHVVDPLNVMRPVY